MPNKNVLSVNFLSQLFKERESFFLRNESFAVSTYVAPHIWMHFQISA